MVKKIISDDVKYMLMGGILAVCVVILLFGVPYGDNITVYDTIIATGRYIDNGQYHFKGLLDTSNCGSVMGHLFGMRVYDFTVDENTFFRSFTDPYMDVQYTCKNGQITDIKFG